MAASKVMCRLSSRLQPLAHSKLTKPSLSLKPNLSPSAPRLSPTSRLPVELSSWESMMPLHSAVASARLVSSLTIESSGWGLVPQVCVRPLEGVVVIYCKVYASLVDISEMGRKQMV